MHLQQETTLSLETIDRFRSWLLARGRSPHTAKAYSTDLRVLLKELEVLEIDHLELELTAMNWLNANRRRIPPRTTGRRLTALRAYGKFVSIPLFLVEYIAPNSGKGQPHPLPEGTPGVRKMIYYANRPNHKALIALCGLCGLRVAEALDVRPSHLDFQTMMLTVRGKGDKTRVVPVSAEAWEVVKVPFATAFCRDDALVVGLKDRFARKLITTVGARAMLCRSVASHDLRATFATAVFDKTKDQRVVQELLGHASGATTELYIGVTQAKMRAAVEL